MIRRGSSRLGCVAPIFPFWWFSWSFLGFSGGKIWGCFFEGFLLDVTYEDLVPLILVTLIQQTLRNDFDLGVFDGFQGKVFLRVDFWFPLIDWVLGASLLDKGSPWGAPSTPKVSLWSVEWIGRSISWSSEFFPRVVFFSTVQAKTGLIGFPNRSDRFRPVGCREGFLSEGVSIVLWLLLFRCGKALEVFWVSGEFLGSFWTKLVWPVCQIGLTRFPCLCETKSNRSCLTGFRNRPDRFWLTAAVSCVFPLRVSCGCWLGLAPRSSSTSVAAWTWQKKLAKVHEWNRVHRLNSWIEFLSAPIHSPLSGSPYRSFKYHARIGYRLQSLFWGGSFTLE
jgi:hypothetical protein